MNNDIFARGLVLAAVAASLCGALSPVRADDSGEQSRIRKGFQIAPVALDLRGKNRALVGLGSYIVNAQGGCNDCHTAPPYSGVQPNSDIPIVNKDHYLAGGTPFGPVTSKNITPDERGLPAGLTRKEFIGLMRTGHDPHEPGYVLQVMPWPVYRNMVDRDLIAVYEYLRTIPSLPGNR